MSGPGRARKGAVRLLVSGAGDGERLLADACRRRALDVAAVDVRAARLVGSAAADSTPDSTPDATPDATPGTVWVNRVRDHHVGLGALRALEALGRRCVNAADVVAACGDVQSSAIRIARAGVPAPRFEATFSPRAALDAAREVGFPASLTPVTGGRARMVVRVRDADAARAVLFPRRRNPWAIDHAWLVRAAPDGAPVRAAVIDGRAVAAWRPAAPRCAGGPAELDEDLSETSLAAAAALGGGALQVRLLRADDGSLLVEGVDHVVDLADAIRHAGECAARRCAERLVDALAGP